MSNDNDRALLESFVVNNPDLERLEALLAEFNIFEAIGAVRQELRHSDFLAFLLDPSANHRLGDAFLKRLLKHVLIGISEPPLSAVEIDAADLEDAEVRREWQNIDILIHDPANRLVCVIENKVVSGEHSDQLRRYRRTVEQHYADLRRIFIYLTPEGNPPSDQNYFSLSYGEVAEILEAVRRSHESTLGNDVRILLRHYVTMLRRHIVADSEIIELCRKLYRQHKPALDLIYEHRPDLQSDLQELVEDLVNDAPELELDHSTKSEIRFLPRTWDQYGVLLSGEGWTPSGRILLFGFVNRADHLALHLYIGPGPQVIREAILETCQRHDSVLNGTRGSVNKKWKTIHKRPFLTTSDYEDPDFDSLTDKISSRWERFLESELPQINQIVGEVPWDELSRQLAGEEEDQR